MQLLGWKKGGARAPPLPTGLLPCGVHMLGSRYIPYMRMYLLVFQGLSCVFYNGDPCDPKITTKTGTYPVCAQALIAWKNQEWPGDEAMIAVQALA